MRPIYTAASEGPWGAMYPTIVQSWQRAWVQVTLFFVLAPEIQRVVYTTNAIESLNMQIRKIIKTRRHFPNDKAAMKQPCLTQRNILAKSVRAAFDWKSAMNLFAILLAIDSHRRAGDDSLIRLAHKNTDRFNRSIGLKDGGYGLHLLGFLAKISSVGRTACILVRTKMQPSNSLYSVRPCDR